MERGGYPIPRADQVPPAPGAGYRASQSVTTGAPPAGRKRRLSGPGGSGPDRNRPSSSASMLTVSWRRRMSTTPRCGGTIWPMTVRSGPAEVTSTSMVSPPPVNETSRRSGTPRTSEASSASSSESNTSSASSASTSRHVNAPAAASSSSGGTGSSLAASRRSSSVSSSSGSSDISASPALRCTPATWLWSSDLSPALPSTQQQS